MEISNIGNYKFRNAQHVQFHTDFSAVVDKYSAAKLGIDKLYKEYVKLFSSEKESLNLVSKSATTQEIGNADIRRDTAFRGVRNSVKVYLDHYIDDTVDAAKRMKILFDTYGNIAYSTYDEETAQITALVGELDTTYREDVKKLNLVEWIKEMNSANLEFDSLKRSRYSEAVSKVDVKMKDIRIDVDEVFEAIVRRVNALIEINGEAAYKPFVKELNARIESYNSTLSMKGKKSGKDVDVEVVEV